MHRLLGLIPLLMALLALPACQSAETYHFAGQNIWQLELLSQTGQLVLGSYDGKVGIYDQTGRPPTWIFASESFIMDLKTADLEGDGEEEILLVNAGGELLVLDLKGTLLFRFQSSQPLYAVDAGNLMGDANLEVACGGIDRKVYVLDARGNLLAQSEPVERLVHRLAIGQLDDDPYEEILVIENRVQGTIMDLVGGELQVALSRPLAVPPAYVNWENPRGSFHPFSLRLEDLDGDGRDEVVAGDTYFNKQAVAVFDHQLQVRWISERVPAFELIDGFPSEFYATAFVECADVLPQSPGKEVLALSGGLLRIWDQTGKLLASQNCALGFTDFAVQDQRLWLASAPNGDDYIYSLLLEPNWQATYSQLSFQGHIREIKDNTRKIARQVNAYQPTDPAPRSEIEVVLGFSSVETTPEWVADYQREKAWFRARFPYDNLRIIKSLKVIEDTPPLMPDGQPWNQWRYELDAINGTQSVEEILAKARWIEAHQVPTFFYIGHSCTPFITLETAEKILQAAPNYCLGFRTAEDEQIELIPEYFEHYFGPLTELCLRYGYKRCVTKNKGIWWMSTPSIPAVYRAVFAGESKRIMVAATEDSNSRTPEMNLLGRGGLWQAGLVAGNDVSIHRDLFSFNRYQQWEYPRVGHPFLRLLVAHATLGITLSNSRIRDLYRQEDSLFFTQVGQESTEIFYHLLGKGLVFSPHRDQVLGYSPLGVVVHQPPELWLRDAHNGHAPERWVEADSMHEAVFPHNGSLWGMTNTPEHAFQRVIFQKERQFGYQIPATPYGLVAFVPEQADTNDVAHISRWLHSDGMAVWQRGGPRLTGAAAATFLQEAFEAAAQALPFRVKGHAFLQTLQTGEGQYWLYLVDPGWLDPQNRAVSVAIQLPGSFTARDLLSGASLPIADQQLSLQVPAGLFRIIEVTRTN